jgi:signal peptidase II
MNFKKQNNTTFFLIAIALVIIDQLSKISIKGFNLFGIVHHGMTIGDRIPAIDGLLNIAYVENEGMAFGIEFGVMKIALSLFSVAASIILIIIIRKLKESDVVMKFGFSLILAGAFGNLIDRVFYGVFYGGLPLFFGRVVDFLEVNIPDVVIFGKTFENFFVFNVADSCVTCGVVILLLFHKQLPNFNELFAKKPKLEATVGNEPDNFVNKGQNN